MEPLSLAVGVVGTLASVFSMLWATKGLTKRAFGLVALVIIGATYYYLSSTLNETNRKIARMTSISRQASELASRNGDLSDSRGFVFASLSFLEAHKLDFPDTYERAKALCETHKCFLTVQKMSDRSDLSEAADVMASILAGISIMSDEKP